MELKIFAFLPQQIDYSKRGTIVRETPFHKFMQSLASITLNRYHYFADCTKWDNFSFCEK